MEKAGRSRRECDAAAADIVEQDAVLWIRSGGGAWVPQLRTSDG